MKEKFVRDAMTHLQGLYMLSIDTVLNQEQLDEVSIRCSLFPLKMASKLFLHCLLYSAKVCKYNTVNSQNSNF